MIPTQDIQVTVFTGVWSKKQQAYRFPMGWPHLGDKDISKSHCDLMNSKESKHCHHTTLHRALTATKNVPAWMVAYAPRGSYCRLNKPALCYNAMKIFPDPIKMQLAIFDFDAHSGKSPDVWFEEHREGVNKLLADNPGMICYRSKNGARLIGLLPVPFNITCQEDSDQWHNYIEACCNYIARVYGIRSEGSDTPDKLGDWGRFQRIPHDTRKRGEQPANYEIIGDTSVIGYWRPELTEEDWPKKKVRNNNEPTNYGVNTPCLLLELVQQALLRCEPTPLGVGDYDICCPDWQRHSPNEQGLQDYPGKTVLKVGPIGSILCLSSGCRHRAHDPKSWLALFPDYEVEQARATINEMEEKIQKDYYENQKRLDALSFDELMALLTTTE